jgi:signal transduction histidine kinase
MSNQRPDELFHERSLAERTAWIRVILTVANLVIIALDPTVPASGTFAAYTEAFVGGGLFLLYAFCAWRLVKSRRVRLQTYALLSPFLDVLFTSILLITTEGYLSPFNLWFVFAVIASGFSRFRMLPLATAGLALVAHSLIATIPQAEPIDLSLFAVRTGYLFAIAAVLSSIGTRLVEDSVSLAAIENAGRQLTAAATEEEVTTLLMQCLRGLLGTSFERCCFEEGRSTEAGEPPQEEETAAAAWALEAGGEKLGDVYVHRAAPLTPGQDSLGRTLCERAASALLRIRLDRQLTEAAVASERTKLADQLHDTYLQSLAALALRAEAARRLANGPRGPLVAELEAIQEIAQLSASQIREIFEMASVSIHAAPATLAKLVASRWPAGAEVNIAPDLKLPEGRWRAIEMLVREGLNNAKKHAGASWVSLRVCRTSNSKVMCRLENDGPRIQMPIRPGYGLSRVRAVVEEQGGVLRIEAIDAGGAALIAEFEASDHETDPRPDRR